MVRGVDGLLRHGRSLDDGEAAALEVLLDGSGAAAERERVLFVLAGGDDLVATRILVIGWHSGRSSRRRGPGWWHHVGRLVDQDPTGPWVRHRDLQPDPVAPEARPIVEQWAALMTARPTDRELVECAIAWCRRVAPDEAAAFATAHVGALPADPAAHALLGATVQRRRPEEAVAAFDQAAALAADGASRSRWLLEAARVAEWWDPVAAVDRAGRALALASTLAPGTSADVVVPAAHDVLGLAALAAGDAPAAADHLAAIGALRPTTLVTTALPRLAEALLRHGRHDDVVAYLTEVAAHVPSKRGQAAAALHALRNGRLPSLGS